MRFNVKFTISKDGNTQSKFEVLESNNKYDKINTKSILSKKYPDYEITVIKISQSVTATSEII
jgi:hypothetical protein